MPTNHLKSDKPGFISIVLPVYNAEKTLERTIDSILSQTFRDFILIIVNDGSTDSSAEIIRRKSLVDSRIRVVWQNNSGVASARNRGLKETDGIYVSFIDSDDIVEPDYLEKLIEATTASTDLVIGGFRNMHHTRHDVILADRSFVGHEIADFINQHILGNYAAVCWGKLFRRDIIQRYAIRFPDGQRLAEDAVFNFSFISHCKSISLICTAKYHYNENTSCKYEISKEEFITILSNLEHTYSHLEQRYEVTIPRSSESWLLGFRPMPAGDISSCLDEDLSLYRIPYPEASMTDYLNDIKCSPVIKLLLDQYNKLRACNLKAAFAISKRLIHDYHPYLSKITPPYTPLKIVNRINRLLSIPYRLTH